MNNTYPALSDDLSIIKKEKNDLIYYQTPYIEKNDWIIKNKKKFRIGKLFFIRKSNDFKIEKIQSKIYVVNELTKQIMVKSYFPKQDLNNLLSFIQNFNEFYFLYFAKNSIKLTNLIKTVSEKNRSFSIFGCSKENHFYYTSHSLPIGIQ